MMRAPRLCWTIAAIALPLAAVHAAGLTIVKSSVVVADSVNVANPKALPGATVDYSLLVSNPNSVISGTTFKTVVISDTIPANTVLRVDDYATPGAGPIEFTDGGLLGLLGSNLSLVYKGLSDDTDGVEFYDGTTWNYHPTSGYDPAVRAIRITLTGTQAVSSSFRLRFRVMVK
jgi:uncharacterized repeat protein (TIGR01451 family)